MKAVAEIAQKLHLRRRAYDLSIAMIGARGKWDEGKKMIKDWSQ